jgi:hypothetical protein
MSLFLVIPGIDPDKYDGKIIALAAWNALQAIEQRKPSTWLPRKRRHLDTAWQIDRANSWQILKRPRGFELFSYYGEDTTAATIVAMIPKILTAPANPEELVYALQDPIHIEVRKSRLAKSVRSQQVLLTPISTNQARSD